MMTHAYRLAGETEWVHCNAATAKRVGPFAEVVQAHKTDREASKKTRLEVRSHLWSFPGRTPASLLPGKKQPPIYKLPPWEY